MGCLDIPNETVFTMEMTPIKFGAGATDEVAYDLKRLGVKHALIITDRGIMKLGLPERVRTLLQEASIALISSMTFTLNQQISRSRRSPRLCVVATTMALSPLAEAVVLIQPRRQISSATIRLHDGLRQQAHR